MSDAGELQMGMSFEEVRKTLKHWKHEPAGAVMSPDRHRLYHTWDFTPPEQCPDQPLRITFDNGRLLIWGEPAAFDHAMDHPDSA